MYCCAHTRDTRSCTSSATVNFFTHSYIIRYLVRRCRVVTHTSGRWTRDRPSIYWTVGI